METVMGKVLVDVRVENFLDLERVSDGRLAPEQVRTLEIPDALVDTGAMYLGLPSRMVQELGLRPLFKKNVKTTNGTVERTIYGVCRVTIRDRQCHVEAAELPDDCPVLIGQLPLEAMDWVVDCANQQLIGNPAHGGKEMYDRPSVSNPRSVVVGAMK